MIIIISKLFHLENVAIFLIISASIVFFSFLFFIIARCFKRRVKPEIAWKPSSWQLNRLIHDVTQNHQDVSLKVQRAFRKTCAASDCAYVLLVLEIARWASKFDWRNALAAWNRSLGALEIRWTRISMVLHGSYQCTGVVKFV